MMENDNQILPIVSIEGLIGDLNLTNKGIAVSPPPKIEPTHRLDFDNNGEDVIVILPPPMPKPNFDDNNIKILYPSDVERRKSPREYGTSGKCRNHKRNNKKRR